MNKPRRKIPRGCYCYSPISVSDDGLSLKIKKCPYWSIKPELPERLNGYCSYMGVGDMDFEGGMGLLWDMVKECGVKR